MSRTGTMSEYEFDQCMAEAKAKLGIDRATALLSDAAKRFGWPIAPQYRIEVVTLMALAVRRAAAV